MRTIDPNNLEASKKEEKTKQEQPNDDSVIEIKQDELENSLIKAQENIDKSYALYLKKNKSGENQEDTQPQYIEQKNPLQRNTALPIDDPFKASEIDPSIGNNGKQSTNNLYANPFTYPGGVPGFLPNSPTKLPQKDFLASRYKFPNQDFIDKKLRGWNWGAFNFTFIWGIFNTRWYIGILMIFVEYIFINVCVTVGEIIYSSSIATLILPWLSSLTYKILLGVYGNRISWKLKNWGGLDHFSLVQDQWRCVTSLLYLFSAIGYILIGCVYWHFAGFIFYIPGIFYLSLAIISLFFY